jgi:RHS repeat-associated protein
MKKVVILLIFILLFSSVSAKEVSITEMFKVSEGELGVQGKEVYYYAGSKLIAVNDKYQYQDRMGSDFKSKSLPFGQSLKVDERFSFTGKEKDSELYYFNARYYDSNLGKFTSVDPVKDNHVYSYVANNPMKYVDPNGMDKRSVILYNQGSVNIPNFVNKIKNSPYNSVIISGGRDIGKTLKSPHFIKLVEALRQEKIGVDIMILEDSIYGRDVFNLIKQYFRERVGIEMDFKFCDEVPADLDNRLNIGISEMTVDDRVKMLISKMGYDDCEEYERYCGEFKRTYEDSYHQEGFTETDSENGGISLISFPFEKIKFDIAKGSKLDHSTEIVIDGVAHRPSDYFIMPETKYSYRQKFASRISNAISNVTGVVPTGEPAEDLAEDHNGNSILDPNAVDPATIKYHFFFTESQKRIMREYFSN